MNLSDFDKAALLAVKMCGDGTIDTFAYWLDYDDGAKYISERDASISTEQFTEKVRRSVRKLVKAGLVDGRMDFADEFSQRRCKVYWPTQAGFAAVEQVELDLKGKRFSFFVDVTDLGLTAEQVRAMQPHMNAAVKDLVHSMVRSASEVRKAA